MFGFTNYSFPLYRNFNRYNRYSMNNPFINSNIGRFNNSNFYKQPENSKNYTNIEKDNNIKITNESNSCENAENKDNQNSKSEFLDLFGIKLYFDDLMIISLLFFLYSEGVSDYYLFITLILLLLS